MEGWISVGGERRGGEGVVVAPVLLEVLLAFGERRRGVRRRGEEG